MEIATLEKIEETYGKFQDLIWDMAGWPASLHCNNAKLDFIDGDLGITDSDKDCRGYFDYLFSDPHNKIPDLKHIANTVGAARAASRNLLDPKEKSFLEKILVCFREFREHLRKFDLEQIPGKDWIEQSERLRDHVQAFVAPYDLDTLERELANELFIVREYLKADRVEAAGPAAVAAPIPDPPKRERAKRLTQWRQPAIDFQENHHKLSFPECYRLWVESIRPETGAFIEGVDYPKHGAWRNWMSHKPKSK